MGTAPDVNLLLKGVAPLQAAGADEVSFLDNRRYAPELEKTLAGAVIVHPDMASRVPPGTVPIVTMEPYAGWARVAALFHPTPPARPGAHLTAHVAEGAWVDPDDSQADGWKRMPDRPWQDEGEDWRQGHAMGPEEAAYRKQLEDDEDGA